MGRGQSGVARAPDAGAVEAEGEASRPSSSRSKAAATCSINVLNHTLDMGIGELQEIRGAARRAARFGCWRWSATTACRCFPISRPSKEQGIDLSVRKFRGLAGPKGTPPDVIAAWEAAIPQAARRSRIQAALSGEQPAARLHPACRVRQVHETSSAGRPKRFSGSPASSGDGRQGGRAGDLVFGTATLALSAGYYLMAGRIPESQLADAIGPQGLPQDLRSPARGAVAHADRRSLTVRLKPDTASG